MHIEWGADTEVDSHRIVLNRSRSTVVLTVYWHTRSTNNSVGYIGTWWLCKYISYCQVSEFISICFIELLLFLYVSNLAVLSLKLYSCEAQLLIRATGFCGFYWWLHHFCCYIWVFLRCRKMSVLVLCWISHTSELTTCPGAGKLATCC